MDKQFNALYKNIANINLYGFTEDVIKNMYQKVCDDQADCISKLKVIKEKIDNCLKNNDGSGTIELKNSGNKPKYNDLKETKDPADYAVPLSSLPIIP